MAAPILVLGATGFVGRHLCEHLIQLGLPVRGASRNPGGAPAGVEKVRADVADPTSLERAMAGCGAVVFLVHRMGDDAEYAAAERSAAANVSDAAAKAGIERIVYLGGVAPEGKPSPHLQSRIDTGSILRAGPTPTVELRAGMIIGPGSASWCITRDLALRLPIMLLPKWLENRSQPIAIADVVAALTHAATAPGVPPGWYDLPGPEVLSARAILERIAGLQGTRALSVSVPFVTPKLSSYWIRLVTRADFAVAKHLVDGLSADLLAPDDGYWSRMPDYPRTSFDDAAASALRDERVDLRLRSRMLEGAARRVSLRTSS